MKDQAAFLQNLCAFLDLKLNIVDMSAIIRRHLGFPWSQAPRGQNKGCGGGGGGGGGGRGAGGVWGSCGASGEVRSLLILNQSVNQSINQCTLFECQCIKHESTNWGHDFLHLLLETGPPFLYVVIRATRRSSHLQGQHGQGSTFISQSF